MKKVIDAKYVEDKITAFLIKKSKVIKSKNGTKEVKLGPKDLVGLMLAIAKEAKTGEGVEVIPDKSPPFIDKRLQAAFKRQPKPIQAFVKANVPLWLSEEVPNAMSCEGGHPCLPLALYNGQAIIFFEKIITMQIENWLSNLMKHEILHTLGLNHTEIAKKMAKDGKNELPGGPEALEKRTGVNVKVKPKGKKIKRKGFKDLR